MKINRLFLFLPIIFLFLVGFSFASWLDTANHPAQTPPVFVQPAPDIEVLWNIEDTRSESAEPLVTYLENNGSVLGYDAGSNTFYCTLGMNTGTEWPDISLCAPKADDVSICFSDDYTYDWCDQAIEEGYAYELIAYTDTEYAYFNLVFTGLPIVTLYAEEDIDTEYVPSFTSISSAEHSPIKSLSKVHLRGAMSLRAEKSSYRIELHRINQQGKDKKNKLEVLGMPADSDWLLISNTYDFSCLRNHLAWEMWKKWNLDQAAFSLLESRMVELFVNNEYRGLYQLMQRIDTDREISIMGGNLDTDSAFRVIKPANAANGNRLYKTYIESADVSLELRKAPNAFSEENAFQIIEPYIDLADIKQGRLSDEDFVKLLPKYMDVYDVVSYYLFSQAIGLGVDNVCNNLYIYALKDGDTYHFTFAPWDMDHAFYPAESALRDHPLSGTDQICSELRIPVRLLNLDGADSRRILWEIWNEKRSTVYSDDSIYQWLYNAEHLVNASGAYMRNAEKWYGEKTPLDITEIYGFAIQHVGTLDRFMRECWPYGEYVPESKSQ